MRITVREALKLPALKDAILLAGEAGLDRVITSVNIMEVPDIAKFVKKDELLLTTAYPIKDDLAAQTNLIPELVKHGLAGLAIKPARYLHEIPKVMVKQAEEMDFPLIKLPIDASFNEIINPILAEILNRQATILRRNEEVHRSLANIVLDGGSLREIARMLASLLHAPVSIHNARMKLQAYSPPPGAPADEARNNALKELASNTSELRSLVSDKKGQIQINHDRLGLQIIVHPVTVAREDYAYLIVWQGNDPLKKCELNVIEQAATVVALEVAKLRAVAEVEHRFRTSFIEELIQGKIESRADALARGELYGWDLSGGFVPLLVEIDDFRRFHLMREGKRDMAQILRRRLWEAVTAAIVVYASGSIAVDMSSRVLVMFRGAHKPGQHKPGLDLGVKIQEEMASTREVTLSIGVGRYLDDILDLKTGFEQADQALEVGRMVNGPGSVTHFDDLGVYRILADNRGRPELDRFCQDLLAGLMENDRQTNSDLVRTLDVVLRCNGNLRQAARELYIHYNTLRYRVNRIEEITGVDLGSAEGRLNLQLALKILRMHNGA